MVSKCVPGLDFGTKRVDRLDLFPIKVSDAYRSRVMNPSGEGTMQEVARA